MNARQAAKLKIGQTVIYTDDGSNTKGKVIEQNWHAVKIEWEDGQTGIFPHKFSHHFQLDSTPSR